MTWTQERHDAARARCETATAGPWKPTAAAWEQWLIHSADGEYIAHVIDDREHPSRGPGNAAFIASVRTDLPDALDEIDRLRAALLAIYRKPEPAWGTEPRVWIDEVQVLIEQTIRVEDGRT